VKLITEMDQLETHYKL